MRASLKSIEAYNLRHPDRDIDLIIRDEVVPYVKSFSSLPQHTQDEAVRRASTQTVSAYTGNLKNAWDRHNRLAVKIDQFLMSAMDWKTITLRLNFVDQARTLVEEAMHIEDEKRIYSAGVKHALDLAISKVKSRYRLTSEESLLISTLCEPAYWDTWMRTHIEWVLSSRGISLPNAKDPLSNVLQMFHSGSMNVFRKRLQREQLAKLNLLSDTELLERHQRLVQLSKKMATDRTRLGYISLGRPDIKAIQELLRYDNLTEYIFGINLWGFPDLMLRKGLANRLIQDGMLDKRPSILFYSREDFLCEHANNGTRTQAK